MRRYGRYIAVAATMTLLVPGAAPAQDVPEMSPEATAFFADGMAKYTAADYEGAAEAFSRAHELDPSFALAAFFEGLNRGNAGQAELAREAYARAAEGRERMSPYYRHRLAAQVAGIDGDIHGYVEENRKAAALAPGSKAAYNVAQGAVRLRRPREAVEALESLDPDAPPMNGWSSYWSVLVGARHQLGEYERQLEEAREARTRFPENATFLYGEAAALAGLGRVDELGAVVDDFRKLDAPLHVFLVSNAAEAEAHGHPATARELLDEAMDGFEGMSPEEAGTTTTRQWKAIAHYNRGELAEAEELFRGLVAENPESDGWRAWVGLVAGERGDRDAARAEIDRLSAQAGPDDGAMLYLYAASIAAAMGDGDRFEELISEALDRGVPYSIWDHRHPAYRRVRDHPAYADFTRPRG